MGFIEGVLCKLGIAAIIRAGRFLIDWATQKWLKRRIPRWVWWLVSPFIGDWDCVCDVFV